MLVIVMLTLNVRVYSIIWFSIFANLGYTKLLDSRKVKHYIF